MSYTTESAFYRKYHLTDRTPIGKGTFALVYKCVNRITKESYAVKIVDKNMTLPNDIQSVSLEVHIMKQIGNHPHVARLVDYFETRESIYIVMDLLSGGMVFDRIAELSHYDEKIAADLVRNVLSGLVHIHSRGIIHRDLKPENLLLRPQRDSDDTLWLSDVCISDFGLASTGPGKACCGTAKYIAPEVVKVGYYGTVKGTYDNKCDVWSLGVITFVLLSGKMPFYGATHREIFRRIVDGKWSFGGPIWNTISLMGKSFIRSCLTRDPAKRPSARELLNHPWITDDQPDKHLGESIEEIRSLTAITKLRGATAVIRTSHEMLGGIDSCASFTKHLRHKDKLSTIIEVVSQTDPTVVHLVDFGKVLASRGGHKLQDCCSCSSQTVCRHIQNVHEYLFVGNRRRKVYPFLYSLRAMQSNAELDVKLSLGKDDRAGKVLSAVEKIIEAAFAFSTALEAVPQERLKGNVPIDCEWRQVSERTKALVSGCK
ncbi:protein kinase [Trypanosoma brucei equiperdum]|uniref:Protein kinase n=1 Tax=Trypanosoma brucei equiperdum TaxID=630700 RepID=A0A3L6LBW8_9TRYP|nr:protein kinase [Trypanosoma brucei equiperdum]